MGARRNLSEEEKAQIKILRQTGKSIQEISDLLKRSKCSIHRYLSKKEQYGKTYKGIVLLNFHLIIILLI